MTKPALWAAACVAMVALLAQRAPVLQRGEQARFLLPEPAVLKAVGNGELPLITDLYWLKAINFGVYVSTPFDGRAMLGLGRLITDLDPNFKQVYWYVALNAPPFDQ